MTVLVQAAELIYAHGGNQIFDGVSFEVKDGERLALVGENGAGKSTLFRLLMREIAPQRGTVVWRNNLTVGYLTQESNLDPNLTARDAVAAAAGDPAALDQRLRELEAQMAEDLDDDAMTAVLDEYGALLERADAAGTHDAGANVAAILAGLRFPEDRWDSPVRVLSGGERRIVSLARFLIQEPDLLLLDEPDNHLDESARAWLEEYLRARRGGLAVISHDRYFIDRVANRILELEDGRIISYTGNYTAFQQEKRARLEREEQLYEMHLRDMKKLKESAEALTQWARQNPKFAQRARNRWRMLENERERLEATPTPILDRKRIDVEFSNERGSSLVLEARGLAHAYGERQIIRPVNFELRHGERVGIVGANGAGKSTLFRLIMGTEEPVAGRVRVGPSITVGYYSQLAETLDANRTPLELVRNTRPMSEQQGIGYLVGLLFTRDDALNRVSNLSGGERARLQIALMVLQGANFLLLDEPTNNLDIPSIEVLEEALLEFNGTILTISHDRYFLDRICQRIISIDDGWLREYAGGFSFYDRNRGTGALLHEQPVTAVAPVPPGRRQAKTAQRS